MYGILVQDDFGMGMPQLRDFLLKREIDTRTFFIGMHRQPAYRKGGDERFPDTGGSYPAADELMRKGLYLPSSSHLTEEQITEVIEAVRAAKEASGA